MEAIIGLLGVIIGIALNEFLRRMSRIETLNNQIFNERLKVFTELFKLMYRANSEINKLQENIQRFEEDKHAVVSSVTLSIAEFLDENAFFISDELQFQCFTLYLELHDETADSIKGYKEKLKKEFANTIEMIKNESGIKHINKKYKHMFGFKHKSGTVNHLNDFLKNQKKLMMSK